MELKGNDKDMFMDYILLQKYILAFEKIQRILRNF